MIDPEKRVDSFSRIGGWVYRAATNKDYIGRLARVGQ
jgi:hypothetical protein